MAKKGKSTILPIGGMDSDSEARFIDALDYRYALNIRNGVAYINEQKVVTNVKGNVEVPYTLPAGANKCIGTYEDKQGGTIIYFVQNSNHNDTILRYYPSDTAPFGTIEQLAQHNFGWSEDEFITGIDLVNGKLLYWTDRVMPRKLNIEKSNLTGKVKTWDMLIPETLTTSAIVTISFANMAGAVIYSVGQAMTNPSDRASIITDIAANLNANVDSPVTAEACACHLKFTEKVAGSVGDIYTDQLTPNGEFLLPVIPDNWYGLALTDRMADAGKWMPLFEPLPTFEKDENYEPNYVKNKVFQFRLQYEYDDFEETALGVISQIPINNLGCDGISDDAFNYIYIDFNEPELLDLPNLVLIKKVTLLAREHNEGNWRSIIVLEPCDWLDTDDDGNLICRYKFYGDIGGRGVDAALVAKQYDNIPIVAGTQKFVKNRLNYGDVEIGRDAPDCVDAKAQLEFVETPNPKLYKVKFRVRILTYGLSDGEIDAGAGGIRNLFPGLWQYPFWYPGTTGASTPYTLCRGGIFHDVLRTEQNFAFFGGGGFGEGAGGDFGIRSGMETTYNQLIPEAGFVVYCAGTPYFGITKQINIGLPTDADGALDTSTETKRNNIGNYLYGGGDLYSEVELLLPAGEYVARLASHWCSFGDDIEMGFAYDLSAGDTYQKTSTNVFGIFTDNFATWNKKKEWKFTVTNSDLDEGVNFLVSDLAPPWDVEEGGAGWIPVNCYLYDDSNGTQANADPNSPTFSGIAVERALVRYQELGAGGAVSWDNIACTDHNGYWFGTVTGSMVFVAGGINGVTMAATTTMYVGSLTDFYEKTLTPIPFGTADPEPPDPYHLGLRYGVIATDNPLSRITCSTIIHGKVVDSNGNDVQGAIVIYETGRVTTSANNGIYDLVAWGDMITPNIPNFPTITNPITNGTYRTADSLIFNFDVFCIPSFPNGQEYNAVDIDPIGVNSISNDVLPNQPPFSPTSRYVIPDFVINEANNPSVKARKRGGNYIDCIRLYDDLGRCSSPVKAYDLYIPFITEDIGKYGIENFNGVVYPSGTFRYGKPSVKWVLNSNTVFPTWAKKFQWMRTTNAIYGRYLQWVANQVTYLSATQTASTPEIETSFQNSDAVAIKISLSNITSYYAANNDSLVSYTYISGDRLRLIADRTLVNYSSDSFPQIANNVNDFEITSYDSTTQSVIIKPNGFPLEIQSGTLFEIFNPKNVETPDGQLFYETGEVIGITNGIPDSFSGVFTNGDTYWRGRLIIVNDDATKFASAYPVVIEDASVSDFYSSLDEDIGRAAVIDPNFKQLRYPTRMQCSNVFIAGSTINGLASFEAINYKELPREYGTMKRMFVSGQVFLTVHENKLVSNYIELTTISDATVTDGLLAISDKYYGNDRPSQTDNGCQHGESCIEYNGKVWGLDASKGLVWQYDNNGDDSISKYKMISYFKDFCVKGVEWCIPAYDKYRNELIFSIKNSEETITIAYDNAKNRWATFYSFQPEYFGAIGTNVVAFLNGALWAMDKSSTYNNWFGAQYDSRLTIVPNDNSELNKVWDSVKLENLEDANKLVSNWEVFNITNNNGQLGRIFKNRFRKIEYFFYSTFGRDGSDVSVQFPYVNGRELRSPYLIMEMKNDTTQQFQLRSAVVEWTSSEKNIN